MTDSLCFIDSNIWLYSLLVDPVTAQQAEMRKRSLAIDLINTRHCVVSTQVVNEVCSVLTRKAKLSEPQIKQIIESFYDQYSGQNLSRFQGLNPHPAVSKIFFPKSWAELTLIK